MTLAAGPSTRCNLKEFGIGTIGQQPKGVVVMPGPDITYPFATLKNAPLRDDAPPIHRQFNDSIRLERSHV